MNLIIDVGNSFVKLAVFQNGLMKYKTSVRIKEVLAEVKELTRLYSEIDKAIISSVGKFSKDDITIISELVHLVVLDSNIMLPFKNLYKTPKTLGVDRLALVCASVSQFSENNVLIIDAGTCMTFDFVNAENEYLGGAISPGIRMRYQSYIQI